MSEKRKRKLFMKLLIVFLFICTIMSERNMQTVQADTMSDFTVYGSYVSDTTQRYNFLSMAEIQSQSGGNWYGQYSKDMAN